VRSVHVRTEEEASENAASPPPQRGNSNLAEIGGETVLLTNLNKQNSQRFKLTVIYCAKNKLPAGALTLSTGGVQQKPPKISSYRHQSICERVPFAFATQSRDRSGDIFIVGEGLSNPATMAAITLRIKHNLVECYSWRHSSYPIAMQYYVSESLCARRMESWPCKFDELFLEA
jgi:hypothetical protein